MPEPQRTPLAVSDPNNVPDTLASGPINLTTTGGLAILTFTQARLDTRQQFAGKPNPDTRAVVVARIVMPISAAFELQGLLQHVLGGVTRPAAGNA